MSRARSLADSLRARGPEWLAELLVLRPDLALPPPVSLAELVERASTSASTTRALENLDAWTLRVAEALAVLPDPAGAGELASITGAPVDAVEAALAGLVSRALVWRPDEHSPYQLTNAARLVFGPFPAGLAPRSPEAAQLSTEQIDLALAQAGEDRAVLERLLWSVPTGAVRHADRIVDPTTAHSPIDRLLALRLLRPTGPDEVILPREVALVLRGQRWFATEVPTALPDWQPLRTGLGAGLPVELIDRAAIGNAQELSSHVVAVAETLAETPAHPLAQGGIARKDALRLERIVGDPVLTRLVTGLAVSAGLITVGGGQWLPTRRYDHWLAGDAWSRWLSLRQTWQTHPEAPVAEGPLADPAARETLPGQQAAALRGHLWQELLSAPAGTGIELDSLAARMRWRRPPLAALDLSAWLPALLREADALGLTAFGRRSGLVDARTDPGFSQFGDRVRLQSDLTAIAPAPLDPQTYRSMRLLASTESHGATGAYRFSSRSLRRALDAGWTAQEVADWLREHSDGPLPDAITRLISDVAHEHGRIQVMALSSVLLVDDPSTAEALLRDPQAAGLGLTRLAPTVLGALADAAELVELCHQRDLAPTARDISGHTLTSPAAHRLPGPAPEQHHQQQAPDPSGALTLARLLISRDQQAASTTTTMLTALQDAARTQQWVQLHYVAEDGLAATATVRVLSVVAGVAMLVQRRAGRLSLPVSRVAAVLPLDAQD